MKKLKVRNIDNYIYDLIDEKDNNYKLNVEFQDIEFKIEINDIIYINEQLLFKKEMYSFGKIDNKYGKVITDSNDSDILIIIHDGNKYYLKRIYG